MDCPNPETLAQQMIDLREGTLEGDARKHLETCKACSSKFETLFALGTQEEASSEDLSRQKRKILLTALKTLQSPGKIWTFGGFQWLPILSVLLIIGGAVWIFQNLPQTTPEEALLEHLRTHHPAEYQSLMLLRSNSPEQYQEKLRQLVSQQVDSAREQGNTRGSQ